jgi:hypothetical protein
MMHPQHTHASLAERDWVVAQKHSQLAFLGRCGGLSQAVLCCAVLCCAAVAQAEVCPGQQGWPTARVGLRGARRHLLPLPRRFRQTIPDGSALQPGKRAFLTV